MTKRAHCAKKAVLPLRYSLLVTALSVGALTDLPAAIAAEVDAPEGGDNTVVTVTGRPQKVKDVAGTVQIIDQRALQTSGAQSLTDVLAQHAVGFLSQWSPAQTSINIRGAASDGQGRDFNGQVLVLIDGRRAGTANLSKIAPSAIERIEIIRGPASVIYGSQNIGGVINIITKNGLNTKGITLSGTGGSWGLGKGAFEVGGKKGHFDYFVSLSGGRSGDYHSGEGGGREVNTQWVRDGALAVVGYQINALNRVELSGRIDGIYDSGFRGSGANYYSKDNRINNSADLTYTGSTKNKKIDWSAHFYDVHDEDNFHWASPVVYSNGKPAAGTSADNNKRNLDIVGSKMIVHARLLPHNDALIGSDLEQSVLRSTRRRVGVNGASMSQTAPYDNNQTDQFVAFYAQDQHRFFHDKVALSAGIRQTWGHTRMDRTPYRTGLISRTAPYQATTWSVGTTYKPVKNITLRAGAASGFRAPTATELAADFDGFGGGRTFGNPNLKPERNQQIEVGLNYTDTIWQGDVALFQNSIRNRITTQVRPGYANTYDYVNKAGNLLIRGIELQGAVNMARLLWPERNDIKWSFYSNGNYNFDMKDEGAAANLNTHTAQRVYRYQVAMGARFGSTLHGHPWNVDVNGTVQGTLYYDTEEHLLIPQAEPRSSYVHKEAPYTIWNLHMDYAVTHNLLVNFAITNLTNLNYHPVFIATDHANSGLDTRFSNGGIGTSLPGRTFQGGLVLRFD
ncbi:TonB-dependent receptor [Acetobacter orientalis]|uniref:TonB-dependent receptor n=1 Tax=Acetobacter orientalis TaxID=146474 RepID=UPI00209D41CE|nr:TonB-dependent receptor [Acetobacter orientalis]MCP1215114.1 TonB-dependent receptor [Acetobacter orientalis]MCP1218697.1 TonB-dependent receptor [Acetobacter orientalis]